MRATGHPCVVYDPPIVTLLFCLSINLAVMDKPKLVGARETCLMSLFTKRGHVNHEIMYHSSRSIIAVCMEISMQLMIGFHIK